METVIKSNNGIELVQFRSTSLSKTGKLLYKYRYTVEVNNKVILNTNIRAVANTKYKQLFNAYQLRKRRGKEAIDSKIEVQLPQITAPNLIIDLINFRLDNLHDITVGNYKTLQDIILLATIYKLGKDYINNIKIRFKEYIL